MDVLQITYTCSTRPWPIEVLAGVGKDPLYIAFTSHNMDMLFREVRNDVDNAEHVDDDGSGTDDAQDSSLSRHSPLLQSHTTAGLKGLRWLPSRRCWDLRYTSGGKNKC